ncbi:MAG: sulfatase-like hydrolase/transferase, partial [Verrucomicrobiales bacterium]|nr:sulfatase-like hydrolase/transferase [Verrucomicrobiales bacterium]
MLRLASPGTEAQDFDMLPRFSAATRARWVTVLGMVLGLWGTVCPSRADSATDKPRPNIVVILADDLGWTDLGCQGSRYYETPHIDRLASRGLRLTQAYSAGPNCQPSRAAWMTGQYGPRTGIYTVGDTNRFDWSRRPLIPVRNEVRLAPEATTIAEVLKGAGYATGLFGKWHLGSDDAHHPLRQGFDEAIVSEGKHYDFETRPKVEVPRGTYLADFLTERATDFVRRHRAHPFFLCVHHFVVHAPIEGKPELEARFRDKPPVGGHRDPVFAAMVASLDASVGKVVAALEEAGVAENTLVVFSSDNGGVGGYLAAGIPTREGITDNAPLRGGKGMLYEGGIRVPLILRWPGTIPEGFVRDDPVHGVDFFPTFARLAGAASTGPGPWDGVDLSPLWTTPPERPLPRESLYWHFPGYLGSGRDAWRTTPVGAVRTGNWKLLEFFEAGRLELYDLASDPGERRDLAEARPDLVRSLQGRLVAWREQVGAPLPPRAEPPPVGPPGIVVAHSPATSKVYLGSPSLVRMPGGDWVASHDFFGPGTTGDRVAVYGSEDRGATWVRRSEFRGGFWSSLFVHRGALYLLGTSRQDGQVVIRRSTDAGRHWTEPKDARTGLLLADGGYHCAPTPVIVHAGRIWRAFEDIAGPGGWGSRFRSFMMSAPEDADLLDASVWTVGERLGRDPSWLGGRFGGWLEGNAVVTPEGRIANLLRADYRDPDEKAAWIEIGDDGKSARFDPDRGFVAFPGGCKKFTVRRDPKTGAYWSLANAIPPDQRGGNVERTRNTLV